MIERHRWAPGLVCGRSLFKQTAEEGEGESGARCNVLRCHAIDLFNLTVDGSGRADAEFV